MANSLVGWRAQFVFALCLPVAVLLGYLLADPTELTSVAAVTLIIGILSIPLLMYSYHPLLIITWNAAVVPVFLPGQPYLWMIVAFVGFGFAILNRFTSREAGFIDVPSVTWPLVTLLAVVLVTAYFRGGLGMRMFGSSQFGGRGYFYIMAAVGGFFALISQRVPKHRSAFLAGLFFLSGITALIPNIAYIAGRGFEFLYYLFPVNYAMEQAVEQWSTLDTQFSRIAGLTLASTALYGWLLVRHGFRGVFALRKPIRPLLLVLAVLGSIFCGYRGIVLLMFLTFAAQLFAEKLAKARVFLILSLCAIGIFAIALPNASKLPFVVQRSLSFLPLDFSPVVEASARGSSEWRLEMWRDVFRDIPKYLIKGKGYSVDPTELEFANYGGVGPNYTWAIISGSYHSGPLTLIIPFGIWGLGAFLWFIMASLKYLYRNYRYGDPDLHSINTFLLAAFIGRLLYYFMIFGNFYTDLFLFTGIVGMSVSINGRELAVVEAIQEEKAGAVSGDDLAASTVG